MGEAGPAAGQPGGPPLGADGTGGGGDDFFAVLSKVLEYMESAVQVFGSEDGGKSQQDKDSWGKRPQLSAVSKRRLATRTLANLKSGIKELGIVRQAGEELQEHYMNTQLQHTAAERSRREVYTQLQSISGSMHETSMKLHQAEEAKLAAQKETDAIRQTADSLEAKVLELESDLQERDAQLAALLKRLEEGAEFVEQAERDLEMAQQEAAVAKDLSLEAQRDANSMKAALSKAEQICDRHQEAIAKLTADNLMFMMKLRKAEKDVGELRQERNDLKRALELQEGPWFDTVRAGIEEQVKYAMRRANELEGELEQESSKHEHSVREMEAAHRQMEEHLKSAMAKCSELEERLHAEQQESARLSSGWEATKQELSGQRLRAENAEAEVRVLNDSMRTMRQECQAAALHVSQVNSAEAQLKSAAASAISSSRQLQVELQSLQAKYDTQLQVNKEVMVRKQDMEWQLMTALAAAGKAANSEPDGPVGVSPASSLVSTAPQREDFTADVNSETVQGGPSAHRAAEVLVTAALTL